MAPSPITLFPLPFAVVNHLPNLLVVEVIGAQQTKEHDTRQHLVEVVPVVLVTCHAGTVLTQVVVVFSQPRINGRHLLALLIIPLPQDGEGLFFHFIARHCDFLK